MTTEFSQTFCSICGQPITLENRGVTCPVCGAEQHEACARQLGHCVTLGCTGLSNSPIAPPPPVYAPPSGIQPSIIPPTPPPQRWEMPGNMPGVQDYTPVNFDLSSILSHAWQTFSANMGMAIAGVVLYFITIVVGQNIPLVSLIFGICYVPLLEGGLAAYSLDIVNGHVPNLGTIFNQFNAFGRWMGSYWLRTLVVFLTMIPMLVICAIPFLMIYGIAAIGNPNFDNMIQSNPAPFILSMTAGLLVGFAFMAFVLIRWVFVPYLVAEGMRTMEAFHRSEEMTRGIRWKLCWYYFVIWLIAFAGVIGIVIGLLFTVPLAMCAMAAMFNAVKTLRDQQAPARPFSAMR